MKLLFDLFSAQPAGNSKFHGGGEYIKVVFTKLVELAQNKTDYSISVCYDKNRYLDDWVIRVIKQYGITEYYISSIIEIKSLFSKEVFDVFYTGMPYVDLSEYIPPHVHKIATFHGLRGIEKPIDRYTYKYFRGKNKILNILYYLFTNRLKKAAYKAYKNCLRCYDEIVCVSNHTKYALMNYFPDVDNPPVFYSPAKYYVKEMNSKIEIDGKYILIISCNRWEKNSYRALSAINDLMNRGHLNGYKIVTIGSIPESFRKLTENKNYYIQYDYVDSSDLEYLYKNCDIFLYISLNEGFGYPPLEAMKYGKTCIVSGICSLPEICGNAVYYCNPYDLGEIQNRLIMAVNCKIEPDRVIKQMLTIKEKQDKDLLALCNFIMKEVN